MPGFVIAGGGNAQSPQAANATIESRRKHRWYFALLAGDFEVRDAKVYLQSAQRPHAVIEEAVMHHDQEQARFAGKHHWEPISLVFYDVMGGGAANAGGVAEADSSNSVYAWINRCINIYNASASFPAVYKQRSELVMTAPDGSISEAWIMYNCWPLDANWNELDYTSTEIQTIDVSMAYDRAERGAPAAQRSF